MKQVVEDHYEQWPRDSSVSKYVSIKFHMQKLWGFENFIGKWPKTNVETWCSDDDHTQQHQWKIIGQIV